MAPVSIRSLIGGLMNAASSVFTDGGKVGDDVGTAVGAVLSVLGTDSAKVLGDFLTNNPLPDGFPWGTKTSKNTNYYTDYPNTGVTRYYDWTITKETIAPDGVNITGLLVNGQFPGPLIEANWGDMIQVTVTNTLEDEGASMHWHGFLQKNTQQYDGVPGISQCPIAPGKTFTYTFQAELYGTTWWHSHWSSQYASGLSGPIVVYGPKNANYDVDLGPVLVTDWYHAYYWDLLSDLAQPLPKARYPYSQNVLINGKNNYDCSKTTLPCLEDAGQAVFNFTSGKTHRLRLINTSADAVMKISIDSHTMKVIANDFVEIEPYETNVVTLGIGQRSDVLVKADQSSKGSYWLRSVAPAGCASNNGTNQAMAAIFYEGADHHIAPTSTAQASYDNSVCENDPLSSTVPYYVLNPGNPATTQDMALQVKSNGTHGLWYMNNVSTVIDYNDPILLETKSGNLTFTAQQNVYDFGSNASVRLVVTNESPIAHPMHLHGHNMFILASGTGSWDGSIVNPNNPQRRDVQLIPASGYIVIQWTQDNPGAWPFHCHISWHLSLGMSIQIVEQPGAVKRSAATSAINQVCSDWWSYTDSIPPPGLVDQFDSGI